MPWTDSHIRDLYERLQAIEARIAVLEAQSWLQQPIGPADCGCLPYGPCWNSACPRRIVISHGTTDGVGFPD